MATKFVQPNKIRSSFFGPKPRPAAPARPPVKPPAAPAPTLEQQATSTVQAQLKPILDQINAAAQQRLQAGSQAITGYTSSLAHELAGIPYGAPYQGGEQKQAAVDSALQQALAGGGAQLAGDLSKRLAMIQDPSVAAAAGQVASQGAAAGNTQLAQGGAALGALIANEAAAKNYGQKLPGIAGLAGLQDVRGLAGQVASDTGKQVADVQGQAPGLINSVLGRLQSQQAAAASAQAKATKINPTLSAAMGVAVNDQGQAILKTGKPVPYTPYSKPGKPASPRLVKGSDGYYLVTPDGQVTKTGVPVAAGQKPPKIVGSDKTGRGILNPDGTITPLPGPWGQPTGTAGGGYTQPQKNAAGAIATAAFNGTPASQTAYEDKATGDQYSSRKAAIQHGVDPTNITATTVAGSTHLTYQQAMKKMLAAKIPLDLAQQALNTYWSTPGQTMPWEKPGQGRPKQSYQQRNPGKGSAVAEPTAYETQKQQAVVSLATQALGTPYVWGGESKSGFDCSGLLQYVWGRQGVPIPRTTYDQWSAGRSVGKGQLQPGDAVFFRGSDSRIAGGRVLPGHVGMYLGDGKFIEAPRTGLTVRVSALAGRSDYMGARRFV